MTTVVVGGIVARWPRHVRHRCRHDPAALHCCPYCEAGLFLCEVCGGSGGSLTTDCPGRRLDFTTLEEVYHGEKDYSHSTGWTLAPSPHSWLGELRAMIRYEP